MQNPLILADATPEGGLLIPITAAAAGGLAGLILASQSGAACTVEVSADGTSWQAVTPPHTLAEGWLRLTRTDTGNLVTVLGLTGAAEDGGETGGDEAPTPLQNGVPVAGLAAAVGDDLRYVFTLPQGATALNLTMSGGTGDGDLFLRHLSPPVVAAGTAQADFSSTNGGNGETITVAAPSAGTWHVLVRAYAATADATLTATWQEAGTGGDTGGDTGGGTGGGGTTGPDPDEWAFVDIFDRATLGSNYEAAQDGPDAPPNPVLVDGRLLLRLPTSGTFSGASGEASVSRVTAALSALRWTGRSAHLLADLAWSAEVEAGSSAAQNCGARIELRGESRWLRVEITHDGEVKVALCLPGGNTGPVHASGLSVTGALSGAWTVTLDDLQDRVQVWQGNAVLIDAPLPPDYAALMGAGGTVALTAWRRQNTQGAGNFDATLTVDNLAVRSGDAQAV